MIVVIVVVNVCLMCEVTKDKKKVMKTILDIERKFQECEHCKMSKQRFLSLANQKHKQLTAPANLGGKPNSNENVSNAGEKYESAVVANSRNSRYRYDNVMGGSMTFTMIDEDCSDVDGSLLLTSSSSSWTSRHKMKGRSSVDGHPP